MQTIDAGGVFACMKVLCGRTLDDAGRSQQPGSLSIAASSLLRCQFLACRRPDADSAAQAAQLTALLDRRPGTGEWPVALVGPYLDLALACTVEEREKRPTMRMVLRRLRQWVR